MRDSLGMDLRQGVSEGSAMVDRIPAVDIRAERITSRLRRAIDSTISAHLLDSTKAGIDAHYRFDTITPGRYLLHSTWSVYDRNYQWLVPIDVKANQRATVDLDNSVERRRELACGEMDDPILGR
jgi:hypothetical protein